MQRAICLLIALVAMSCSLAASSMALAVTPPPDFAVFFASGSAAISERGERTLDQLMAKFRRNENELYIIVRGHTDGAEARRFDPALSADRASAIKSRLIELGVPASRIETRAYADGEPLVQKPPGADEPQNRRVMIEVGTKRDIRQEN